MKNAILTLAIIGSIMLLPAVVSHGADLPHNWPWRGIVLSSSDKTNDEDIERLSGYGVNSVELLIAARVLSQAYKIDGETALSRSMSWIDTLLDACKRRGITAVIKISQFPLDPRSKIKRESNAFWENPEQLQDVVRVAGTLARHYGKRGEELGAYEILSEPLIKKGGKAERPASWPDLMRSIVREIRKHDAKRYIILTPGPAGLASGYADFKPLSDRRIIYGIHMYSPHAYTHQGIQGRTTGYRYPGRIKGKYWDKEALRESLSSLIAFQKRYDVPVWVGEFSAVRWAEGSEQYLKDLIELFDELKWGWAYFCYKSYHGWNPDYDDGYSTDAPEDWKRHYVGPGSDRWKLLRKAFSGKSAVHKNGAETVGK